MDTGDTTYSAAAMGLNVAGQTCFENVTLTPDSTYKFFVSIQLVNAKESYNCDWQTINSGLIIFNTKDWNKFFNPGGLRDPQNYGYPRVQNSSSLWLPPLPEQTHWILHEFTHLLGLSHIVPTANSCSSVMTHTLFGTCTSFSAPTNYTADDLNLLDQLYN